MKTRTLTRWIAGPVAVAVALGASSAAQAQPGGQQPLGQNPPNWNQGGGRGQRMTPEQRAQMREQFLRTGLTQLGVPEKETQDALIAYSAAQDAATAPLQEKQRALLVALANPQTTPEQLTTLLTDWQTATAAEKTRREQALKDLDTSIGYTKSPRLTALLSVMGVLGDESSLTSPLGGAMMGGGMMGGRGGMMGGFGGGGRGQGGQGGRRRGGQRGNQ